MKFYTWWELNNSDFFFAELLVERLRTWYTKDVKNNQTENKTHMKNVTISRRILRTDEQTIGKRGSYTYVERLKNNQMGKDSEKKLKTFT